MKLNYFTMVLTHDTPKTDTLDIWCTRRDLLLRESAYMTEYMLRAMNKEFKFDCARINLVCTEGPLKEGFKNFDGVHEIDVPFDYSYFSLTDVKEKEKYLYRALFEGTKILCKTKIWDFAPFEKHLVQLRDDNFYVDFYHRVKQSPDKKTVAKLYCVQTMAEATFYIDFFVKRKLAQRKLCMVQRTESMLYNFRMNKLVWKDDKTVQVLNAIGRITTEVTMD